MTKAQLEALARQIADKYGLDPAFICAVVEQESNWNTYAIRYEPAFEARYVDPISSKQGIGVTEANARSISWGLMQLMGEVAREYGFNGAFLSQLCDPATGLDTGCKYMASIMGKVGNDKDAALTRWNGGLNHSYVAEVNARMLDYRSV